MPDVKNVLPKGGKPGGQRASSLVFDTIADKKHCTKNRYKGELFYGRRGTLTHFALQDLMCEMEGELAVIFILVVPQQ